MIRTVGWKVYKIPGGAEIWRVFCCNAYLMPPYYEMYDKTIKSSDTSNMSHIKLLS